MRLLIAALALLTLAPAAARAQDIEIGATPECLQAVPASVDVTGGDPIDVRVLLMVDRVDPAAAQAGLAEAAEAYAPLGLRLVNAGTIAVRLSGTAAGVLRTQAKTKLGGGRPPGVDLVYVLTATDLAVGGDPGVSGEADCIGGVAYPTRAFAVGEGNRDVSATILAHELGHLMGAHHHYANCLQGIPQGIAELKPCTLMFPRLTYITPVIGSLEAAVIRGHAESYLPSVPHPGAALPGRSSPEPGPAPASAPGSEPPAAACRAARRSVAAARRRLAAARRTKRRRTVARRRSALRRAQRRAGRTCRV